MRITKRAVARFTIAIVVGVVVAIVFDVLDNKLFAYRYHIAGIYFQITSRSWSDFFISAVVWVMAPALIGCMTSILIYILILKPKSDAECRCRKCGYILKGISEPKCSECGEPI